MTEKIVHKSINITLDLPLQWEEKIQCLSMEKHQSLSELITNIIGNYLGYNLDDININRLQENYRELNQRLTILEKKDYHIEILQNRLNIMEKLVDSLQSQVLPSRDRFNHSLMINEEIEDEPDEILTDFLD